MADPEELLGALPEESPPPEIVLAAVRVFRYRALAAVSIALALGVVGAFVVQKLEDDSRFLVQVARAGYEGGIWYPEGVGDLRKVGETRLGVWEVVGDHVPNPSVFYVHLVGWGPGTRNTSVEISDPRYAGVPTALTGQRYGGGAEGGEVLHDVWFGVEAPGPKGPLTFDAQLVRYRDDGTPEVLGTVPFEIDV